MSNLAPLLADDSPSKISDSYIVAFKDELTAEQVSAAMEAVREIFRTVGGKNSVSAEFSFKAFSAVMDPDARDKVRGLPSVKYVECDQVASASAF